MAVTLKLTLTTQAWRAGVAGVRQRLANLPPALRSIARAGVASTRRRFQAGRGPDGIPWKKSRKKSGQTMILSGLLLRSVSDRPPEANAVEWGSNRAYAALRQFGFKGEVQVSAFTRVVRKIFGRPTKAPVVQNVRAHSRSVDEPARPYLGVSIEDGSTFGNILLRYVAQPLVGGPDLPGETA
jgi:phage gpG-like protein